MGEAKGPMLVSSDLSESTGLSLPADGGVHTSDKNFICANIPNLRHLHWSGWVQPNVVIQADNTGVFYIKHKAVQLQFSSET